MTAGFAAMLVLLTLSDAASEQPHVPQLTKQTLPPNAWVHEHSGAETHGRLMRIDKRAKEIILQVEGQERRFPLADVRLVQKHRSKAYRAGTLGGASAGVGLVVGFFLGLSCELNATCESGFPRMWGMTALFGGVGAALGMSLPEREAIYKGKRASAPPAKQTGIPLLRFRW